MAGRVFLHKSEHENAMEMFSIKRKPLREQHAMIPNVATGSKRSSYQQIEAYSSSFLDIEGHHNLRRQNPKPWITRLATQRFQHGWTFELLSCALAFVGLTAIIVTLAVHQGRPLPQWPRLISINSLISIFTTLFKGALIVPVGAGLCQLKWQHFVHPRPATDLDRFDYASRGPWGSLRLLILLLRSQALATLGALITVLAMAIDPFSQQIIRYQGCSRALPDVLARIPVTNDYTVAGAHLFAGQTALDSKMTAAVYQGLYNPPDNASSIIPFDCVTGNCTFPTDDGAMYSSLGMCSSLQNITDTITHPSNYTYALPSGPTLGEGTTLATVVVSNESSLLSFDTIMFRFRDPGNDTSDYELFGFRSSLYICVNTYYSDISNFILDEQTLFTMPVTNAVYGDFQLQTNRTLRAGDWAECKSTSSPTADNTVAFPFSTAIQIPPNVTVQYYPADCIWSYQFYAVEAFRDTIGLLFDGQNLSSAYSSPLSTSGPSYLNNLSAYGSANMSSVETFLDGLANAISANMRQQGQTQAKNYPAGTVEQFEICVHVEWAWLSLPASLFVLTTLFLFTTIVKTSHTSTNGKSVPIWKSSEQALLIPDIKSSGQDYDEFGRNDQVPSTNRVRLAEDGQHRWKFTVV